MSLKNIESPEKNVKVLEIEIAKDTFSEAVTAAFRKNSAKMTVPGFRKGKAPRNIIEKMYGKEMFYEEALNALMPVMIDEAIKESALETVSQPEVDVKTIDENGVVFTAKVYVKPEVTVREYKGLEAEKSIQIVSEDDINAEIEKTRKRNARNIQVTDRPAADGDTVVIDFEGYSDGVPFEGGKAEKNSLKLGSGQFIPGFEEQIVGKSIGDEFDVNVKFPEEYHAEDLKGKDAIFKVVLHEINFEELPEIDDEFAKDVSEFNTLEEYKADVKATVEKRYESAARTAMEEQLVDALLTNLDADIPEVMFNTEVDAQLQDYAYRLQQQGINMEMYLQYTGMNISALREQFKPGAERQVRTRLALEKIAELEKIESTEEELNEEFEKIAKAYNMEIDVVKERVDINILKHDIAMKKTVDFITDNAKITEVFKTKEEIDAERKAKHAHVHGEDCDCEDDDHVHDENCDHDHE